jgi:hypothetical protein
MLFWGYVMTIEYLVASLLGPSNPITRTSENAPLFEPIVLFISPIYCENVLLVERTTQSPLL